MVADRFDLLVKLQRSPLLFAPNVLLVCHGCLDEWVPGLFALYDLLEGEFHVLAKNSASHLDRATFA